MTLEATAVMSTQRLLILIPPLWQRLMHGPARQRLIGSRRKRYKQPA
jgi:hypothetical protein